MSHRFHPELLRDYDIRGTVGRSLFEADAFAIGRSFGTVIRRDGGSRVAVGYDGRLSSPMLEAALVDGLLATGIDVVRVGLGPTPMLYHAEAVGDVDGAIQVTGSHNPRDDNGFKLVKGHAPFFGDAIQQLGVLAAAGDWEKGSGTATDRPALDAYVARLIQGFDGPALRIGWDAGNGAAGPTIEHLVQRLPGEHHLLFAQVNGNFPNHHPDPSKERNLADLRALVLANKLDFGVAFDGDGDRIGVIDGKGRTIPGDRLIALFAHDVVAKHPGASIVADVKVSQSVFDDIAARGGKPVMEKTGHSHIKSRMKQIGALLGGEMTGHLFFADDYYGFDDGLYTAVRLIRAVGLLPGSLADWHDAQPHLFATPEIRIPAPEDRKFGIVSEIRDHLLREGMDVITIDGVRVRTTEGWWLLRASNTEAALVARAESHMEAGLAELSRILRLQFAAYGLTFDPAS